MRLEDLDYALPAEQIAQYPVEPRDAARLLMVSRQEDALYERRFSELPALLGPDDLLVVNDTRVRPARLRGRKSTGGEVEALLLEKLADGSFRAMLRSSGRQRPGLELVFGPATARLVALEPDGVCRLRFEAADVDGLLDEIGEAPLPPYVSRPAPDPEDRRLYQSVFARVPGAVAAPTASLHFTNELTKRLPIAHVTLHVGPGTFRPIRGELADHRIDPERFEVPEATARAIARSRAAGGRVIAVGTTVVRTLETTGGEAGRGTSDLFIQPGHAFRAVDALITNFHLPRSSLLALVMAFAGVERVKRAYAHARAKGFRFYSYGDAMWLA